MRSVSLTSSPIDVLHSAATVMKTEATSDESVADPNTCMGPMPLRREETMVYGQAGAVPSYKDEETRCPFESL